MAIGRFAVAVASIVGVIISIGSFTSIEAAQDEINGLRDKYFKLYPIGNENLPGLTGSKQFQPMGHLVQSYLPLLLAILWFILLLVPFLPE